MATTEESKQRQALVIKKSGPEHSLRVGEVVATGDTVASSMLTGNWLRGTDSRPAAGALGVLVDNALGYAIMLDRPEGSWSVSSEISIDFCRPLPTDGSRLTAAGRIVHSDFKGGISSGSVVDDSGELIAVCRQHGRWAPPPSTQQPPVQEPRLDADNLLDLFDAQIKTHTDGADLTLVATQELVNPLGNLHGGISLCAADLAAHGAWDFVGRLTDTASVHISYVRPVPLGTTVRFEARPAHHGRSFTVAHVTAVNDAGKPCMIATVTAAARN